jgi:glyoxylase-like metal-dependent hydrolase (beta-lactamase superfamily II)
MATFTIGDVSVDSVIEIALDPGFHVKDLYPEFDLARLDGRLSEIDARFIDEASMVLRMSIHTWVVRAADQLVLIDTCCGNKKARPNFPPGDQLEVPYLERLEAAGVRPEAVDYVLCTHLHVDHCGWNTRLRNGKWVPTFPNARYIFSKAEYDQWNPADPTYHKAEVNANVFDDSVLPIVERGMADMVSGIHTLNGRLRIEPAPGHTFGQIVVKAEAGAAKGVFCGDVLHHPLQILMPEWNSGFCEAPALARHSRRRVLDYCADEGALLMPAHFAPPHAVQVRRDNNRFSFTPI